MESPQQPARSAPTWFSVAATAIVVSGIFLSVMFVRDGGPRTRPNELPKDLDVIGMTVADAEAVIDEAGYRMITEDHSAFGIIVKENFVICDAARLSKSTVKVLASNRGCDPKADKLSRR